MKQIIATIVIVFFTLFHCFSQDTITKRLGDDIKAKILEVGETEIKYQMFDYQNGPTFTIAKSDVLMVRYGNGTKEICTQSNKLPEKTAPSADMGIKGRQDAMANYKGKHSGAGWVLASSILLTPLGGAIPAVACAASEPNDYNLNFPDYELMQNNAYSKAYREQAHKTKKRKIWRSFAIGSGIYILLAIIANQP